jgi:hypothetical protein
MTCILYTIVVDKHQFLTSLICIHKLLKIIFFSAILSNLSLQYSEDDNEESLCSVLLIILRKGLLCNTFRNIGLRCVKIHKIDTHFVKRR